MFYYVNQKCKHATLGKGSFVTASANNFIYFSEELFKVFFVYRIES